MQWKIRKQGGQVAVQSTDVASGAVVGEMALANAESGFSGEGASSETRVDASPAGFDPENQS